MAVVPSCQHFIQTHPQQDADVPQVVAECAYFQQHLDLLVSSECRKYAGKAMLQSTDIHVLNLISSYIMSPKFKFDRVHDHMSFDADGRSAWIDCGDAQRCNALFGPVLDAQYLRRFGLVFYCKFVLKRGGVGVALVPSKWKALNSYFSRKQCGTAAHCISYIYNHGWSRGADGKTQTGWNKYVSFNSPLFIRPGTAAVIEVDMMKHRLSITNSKRMTITVSVYKMDRVRLAFELGNAPASLEVLGHWWKQRKYRAQSGKRRWWIFGPICERLPF